jgi:HEAT repeat protein
MAIASASNARYRPIPFILLALAIGMIFANSLAQGQPLPVVLALIERLDDEDVSVRQAAIGALRAMGQLAIPAIPAIARRLRDSDGYIRVDAAHVLEQFGLESVPALTELLQDGDPRVRELATRTLQQIGPGAKAALPALVERLGDENTSVRQAAVAALHAMGPEAKPAIPAIAQRLRDPDGYIRNDAALTLIDLGPAAVPAIRPLLHDPIPRVREIAIRTLQKISMKSVSDIPTAAR